MKNPSLPTAVHHWQEDTRSCVVVDIVAPRRLIREEIEMQVARALRMLKRRPGRKVGDGLTVVTMRENEAEIEVTECERCWVC
jgi:hypothetical protein